MPSKAGDSKPKPVKATSKAAPVKPAKPSPKLSAKTAPKPPAKVKPAAKAGAKPAAAAAVKPTAKAGAPRAAKAVPTPLSAVPAKAPAVKATVLKPVPTKPVPTRDGSKPAGTEAALTGRPKADARKSTFDQDSLASIHKRLTEQRDELERQLNLIEESATGLSQSEMSGEVSYDEDFADAGSFTFEREKEFSIANNVSDLRSKIDRALHNIEEGTYGICESCGQPIEGPRLKALPHVTLCLKCKKAEERR